MFLKTQTEKYTKSLLRLKGELESSDAVIIGAGAGLSTSAGFEYSGESFKERFGDFIEKYNFTDMYSAGFYPFETLEEYWAYWSRQVYYNRYDVKAGKVYTDLLELMKDKNYFVLTTNVDHQFQLAGFDKKRLFYTQGDYGLWQCSKPCHNKTYDNEDMVRKMIAEQKNMKIPSELVPYCPDCGAPMTMNLRCDDTFVQDEGWYKACDRYNDFIRRYKNLNILLLELGVGGNTPGIIKYPFWQMTANNTKAIYACINMGQAVCPYDIKGQSICIDSDIGSVISDLLKIS